MWNNVIFGFLLIATVCTQCQSIGYPKVKPDNPLELPSEFYDKTNIITGSAIQHSTNTAQDKPEQIPADDNPDNTIAIPQKKYQVTEHVQEDDQHLLEHHDVEHGHHHGEDGAYKPHDDGTGWDIRKSIPGEPGRDYPTYAKVVDTSFTCGGKAAGYYADLESRCQIFRICTTGSVNAFNSFLCPNGSLFNQAVLTCDWWPNVDCQRSAAHYDKNNGHIPQDLTGNIDVRFMLDAPLLHPYKPVQEQGNDDTPITSNHISDTKIYNDFQVTSEQDAVTSKIRYTTPSIQISTFESTPTPSAPIIQSSISTQQYQTGTYDVNETPTTDSLVLLHEIPVNTDGNVLLVSPEQVGDHSIENQSQSVHESTTLSHASFTTETTGNTGSNQTSDPVFLSTSKTIKLQLKHPLFISQINDNENIDTHVDSSSKGGLHLHVSPQLHVSPVVSNHNAHSTDKPFLSQNKPVTFGETNVHVQGPEKISLLAHEDQKQIGLSPQPNVIGTIQTNSGLNIQTGSSVNTNTDKQVIGGLNLANDGVLNAGAVQSETSKQAFAGISKSIELPGTSQGVQQHYARILSHGNEQSTTGALNFGGDIQNQPDQTIKQFGDVLSQQSQSGIQQQALHNQALNNFAIQAQNIHNDDVTSFPSRFNTDFQLDAQNHGAQSNFGVQNQQQSNINTQQGFNQGFSGEIQSAGLQNQGLQYQGLQNQQGFQSNLGLVGQNGYNYNQGFTSGSQTQGAYNLGSLNVGAQVPYNQNAFSNQNSFISNQNGGAGAFNPNFPEQNYQNFDFYTKNNGQNANYEVSKTGAAQNYKGESLLQHANGQTHNYAYKESTKVEIVPSLGFTLTEELGRASYASALINGLVQEKRGASAANYESISPSDVRYSSYQGPSSYLVPQSSVQHLPNAKRESNNQTTL